MSFQVAVGSTRAQEISIDRSWSYEVKTKDLNFESIEIISKHEKVLNKLPQELYSSYFYKLRLNIPGLDKYPDVIPILQVVDSSSLQEVRKEFTQQTILEYTYTRPNPKELFCRLKFTETSYHLHGMSFFIRVAIYASPSTPNMNTRELITCLLSPQFMVYSKKNHTKKAQLEARKRNAALKMYTAEPNHFIQQLTEPSTSNTKSLHTTSATG